MKNKFPYTLVLLACFCFLQSCSNSDKNKTGDENKNGTPIDSAEIKIEGDPELMKSINNMIDKLSNWNMLGHFDNDFVSLMIIHHQGAADMAQVEMIKGDNQRVKEIAKKIFDKQTAEIKVLDQILKEHKPVAHKDLNDPSLEELKASTVSMIRKIRALEMTGNIDEDFVKLMIPHQEGGVELATQEVLNGHHVRLKLLAKNIIQEHKDQIAECKSWLTSN